MCIIKKRILTVLVALAVIVAFTPLLPGGASHALTLGYYDSDSVTSIVFDSYSEAENNAIGYVKVQDAGVKLVSAESSKESVAEVFRYDDHISIDPKSVGSATITVKADNSETATIKVTVTERYMRSDIKHATSLSNHHYGSTKYHVWTYAGATGTIKVKGKTYKIKAVKSDSITDMKCKKIKLKSPSKIKLKDKVKMTIKFGGATYKKTFKVYSGTGFSTVKGSKKTIKVKFYNLHKGDKVKVKYKGKTYTKKIKKNFDCKAKTITFKVKKKVSKSASITVSAVNKDKKSLLKEKIKLSNGFFEWPDEDEDAGSEDYSDPEE